MKRETHIANLISLARKDGVLHAHEIIFIQSLALRMGLDGGAFERILKFPDLVPERLPSGEDEKLQQLAELVTLMHIDFNSDGEEMAYVTRIGVKYGFSEAEVSNLVKGLQNRAIPATTEGLRDLLKG